MMPTRAVVPTVTAMLFSMLVPKAYARALDIPAPSMQQCIGQQPASRTTTWSPPLDRPLSLSTPNLSLREVLDRVAAESGLQFSYSADLIPARRLCLALDRVPVGAALEAMLAGLPLRVMVVGATQIVLAPTRVSPDSVGFARTSSVLDRVVVTGSPDGAPQRSSAFAIEVIDRATLVSHNVTALGQALELAVPGVWMWATSPGAMTAQYANIRGASSFSTSAPKIYLDGIEVANPLLVTQIDAARIERIEVIRGPQGAALYGADAISGVVNVITRVDGTATGAPVIQISSSAGLSQTDFPAGNAFVQQHSASLRAGQGPRTFGAGISMSNVGEYVPGASELRVLADANGRVLRTNSMITATGRLSLQRGNETVSPLRPSGDTIARQSIAQYTLGATASLMPDPLWTVTLIAGVDGFRVNGLSSASLPIPLSLQNGDDEARGGADRLSLRLRGTARMDVAERTMMTFTIGAEQAMLRDASEALVPSNGSDGRQMVRARVLESQWATNSGIVAQGDIAWRDLLYFVAGGRLEQTVGATPLPQSAAMPMLGAAIVRDFRGTTFKLRSGYGRGIRPAQTLMRGASWAGRAAVDAERMLNPEAQAGTEFGADVVWGNKMSWHLTRFDQRASGLIQPVAVELTPIARPGQAPPDPTPNRIAYVLENVGAIDNRGWELEWNARWEALTFAWWWSVVESKVSRVSNDYRGDLRVGDRPLEVPRQTSSFSVNWTGDRLQLSTTIARAADWKGYDRVAIALALVNNESAIGDITGSQLRRFWRDYNGVTRIRAALSWRIRGETSFQLAGENLLDIQRGAPDNATIVAGRTISVGAKTIF